MFEITVASPHTLTTIYNFCNEAGCPDGSLPYAGLVQATNGLLYGTTVFGGVNNTVLCESEIFTGRPGCGTIFEINPRGGALTTLYSFCSQGECGDGFAPYGGLLQDTSGDFYGTTYGGGPGEDGSVFSLSVGLGAFVETRPTSGAVGTAVTILGPGLTGTHSVTFGDVGTAFTVLSDTEILVAVPAGATTGKVHVGTPTRTLSSNVPFQVP